MYGGLIEKPNQLSVHVVRQVQSRLGRTTSNGKQCASSMKSDVIQMSSRLIDDGLWRKEGALRKIVTANETTGPRKTNERPLLNLVENFSIAVFAYLEFPSLTTSSFD